MGVERQLLSYAELYSHEYQRQGLTLQDLKVDMVSEAICMPHITTVSRYIAMQQAVIFVDTIIAPVWHRIVLDKLMIANAHALAFVAKTGKPDDSKDN